MECFYWYETESTIACSFTDSKYNGDLIEYDIF